MNLARRFPEKQQRLILEALLKYAKLAEMPVDAFVDLMLVQIILFRSKHFHLYRYIIKGNLACTVMSNFDTIMPLIATLVKLSWFGVSQKNGVKTFAQATDNFEFNHLFL